MDDGSDGDGDGVTRALPDMKVLFSTQGNSLRLFDALQVALAKRTTIDRCGFVVADSWSYFNWRQRTPDFARRGHLLLKEWEVTSDRQAKPDLDLLARYEAELGGAAGLFGGIVADRRLFLGPDCTYVEDPRRRLGDEELLYILQRAIEQASRLFDELKPDLVVSFVCVTLFDYLTALLARARGIRLLNLRPVHLADRVIFGSTLNDPTPEHVHTYRRCLRDGSRCLPQARQEISKVRDQHAMYEGVVQPSRRPAQMATARLGNVQTKLSNLWRFYVSYKRGLPVADNHVPDLMRSMLFTAFVNPWRARLAESLLRRRYETPASLAGRAYAFYPLHTEPEVSVLVYSRPYVNQVEIIRALAISLPANMILVVKEHPWMVGKRRLSTYRQILNIPRVHLASPALRARDLVRSAALVTVLAGSVGLEAVINGRPVLTIGDCALNMLPETMVRHTPNLRGLPSVIRELLEGHRHDEQALEAFVASLFEISESVNLYSVLLGRAGVYAERCGDFDAEIERLADYLLRRRESPEPVISAEIESTAARW